RSPTSPSSTRRSRSTRPSTGGRWADPAPLRPRRVRAGGVRLTRLGAVRPRTGRRIPMTDTDNSPTTILDRVAQGDMPVLETVFAIQMDALERSGLDEHTYVLVRLAALVAMDAPPASYAVTIAAAADSGVTVEEAQS